MDQKQDEVDEGAVYLEIITEGFTRGVNKDTPLDVVPDWFDLEKFKRGQKFAMDYYFSVNFAEMISLYILFSFPGSLAPLIFTGNSDTDEKSFRRYLSTVDRVKSWYTEDPFDPESEAYANLKAVKAMHFNVSKRMGNCSRESLEERLAMGNIREESHRKPFRSILRKNEHGKSGCPFELTSGSVFVNQAEMSITQFGFMGLLVTFPDELGASDASRHDLDAFVHLWECLGHLLGIDERYNFCKGSLDQVISRCRALIRIWVKPSFENLSPQWEHMSRCMARGVSYYVPGVCFETSFLFLCRLIRYESPDLSKALTWNQYFKYCFVKFFMGYVMRLAPLRSLYNWLLMKKIEKTLKHPDDALPR